jgi:hypothetical protein
VFEVWWTFTEKIDMKKLLIFLFLVSTNVFSQEQITPLICSGRYDDFSQNIRNVEEKGSPIYIDKTTVKVHIPGFSYNNGDPIEFKIRSMTDSKITFIYYTPNNKVFFGSLNRYTGELGLNSSDKDTNQISQMFSGMCVTKKKLF